MRKIKFRAKTIETGEWVYGETVIRAGDHCYIMEDNGTYALRLDRHFQHLESYMMPCDVKTLGQFTGVLDMNGREIYEGDIVKTRYSNRGPVKYNEVNFHVEFGGYRALVTGEYEVVGNIHDKKQPQRK